MIAARRSQDWERSRHFSALSDDLTAHSHGEQSFKDPVLQGDHRHLAGVVPARCLPSHVLHGLYHELSEL